MIKAEAAFFSRAARVTVYGSVNGVVTQRTTSSRRAYSMTDMNAWMENRMVANDRETSADFSGHQLLISMTSGSSGASDDSTPELGELEITSTRPYRASSFAISVMYPDVVLGKGA